ncbi:Predicted metal-dependent enzyme of the double-stranded beta helix superfamily [Bordetella pertussis]|nr:Predicted metal-dependent enzyme of the double-stranded beta helix superfamily [Bordetella pertussis]
MAGVLAAYREPDELLTDCVASLAGLDAIHRLRNVGAGTAISLHVYGVEGDRVATHVNRIARAA